MRNLLLLSFFLLSFTSIKAQWITNDFSHKQECSAWACMGTYYISIDFNTLVNSGTSFYTFSIPYVSTLTTASGPFAPYASNNAGTKLTLRLSQSRVLLETEGKNNPIPIEIGTSTIIRMNTTWDYGFYHVLLLFYNIPEGQYP